MCFFFFQAEDGIRDLVRSRGLGDVYKRQIDAYVTEIDIPFRLTADMDIDSVNLEKAYGQFLSLIHI